jgi:uncharacterized protein (DUF362 family)/ferredoxin
MLNLDIIQSYSMRDIKQNLPSILERYSPLFPASKNAKILIKPNLNANMNALTGNTTDLRLLAIVIEYFQTKGYSHITVAEGTNSGYYRNNISVISRLRVDRLAKTYGVEIIDLNYSKPFYIHFENGVKAGIAKEVIEADLFINMPKLKTHFEMGMSVCLKNLMGCLVGQENKKKTHQSLAKNILHIHSSIKPQLHIVDGMVAMEGLGPTRGVPIHTGVIIAGSDPFIIDLICAKIAGFDYKKVVTLKVAEESGLLDKTHHNIVQSINVDPYQKRFSPPKAGFLASFIHSPKRQNYFLAIRNMPLFNYLCSTKIGGKILYSTGLRQDVFIEEEMECEGLSLNTQRCLRCGKCAEYCPMGLELPNALVSEHNICIHCLYCFCVCPEQAIEFKGELGFMNEQLRQYDAIIRKIL